MSSHTHVDTWAERDLPFLRALVTQLETTPRTDISAADIGLSLSMEESDILRSLRNLKRGSYVVEAPGPRRGGDTEVDVALDVTAEALYAVGVWPTPATALDRMIDALDAIAANTDDTDERTKAQRFAAWLRTGATTVGLSVASAAITGQLPGSAS